MMQSSVRASRHLTRFRPVPLPLRAGQTKHFYRSPPKDTLTHQTSTSRAPGIGCYTRGILDGYGTGPRATMGALHHALRRHSAPLTHWRGAHLLVRADMPTCLMLTTHCRMSPRLSRRLAHVSRGHSFTCSEARSPPGRCLSSAPSAYTNSFETSQLESSRMRRLCGPTRRVPLASWPNVSPALRAPLRWAGPHAAQHKAWRGG